MNNTVNNGTSSQLYQNPKFQFDLLVALFATFFVNIGTFIYIQIRLKLSLFVKKVLMGLQISNLCITVLMIIGIFSLKQYPYQQWPYGLTCDMATMFFHNSFTYSHLISRIRAHIASRTSQQLNICVGKIRKWTLIFTIYVCLVSLFFFILPSTVFEVCITAYNPCVSGKNYVGTIFRYVAAIIAVINLAFCFKYDLALIRVTKNQNKVQPLKLMKWSTNKHITEKFSQPNYMIPISTSILTILKFLGVIINFINIDILGGAPNANAFWHPLHLMIDIPFILILTVRSNDNKKKPIVMPPTGLQDDGEEFYYISLARVNSKKLKRRWSSHFDPKEHFFNLNQSLCKKCKKKFVIDNLQDKSLKILMFCGYCCKRNSVA